MSTVELQYKHLTAVTQVVEPMSTVELQYKHLTAVTHRHCMFV